MSKNGIWCVKFSAMRFRVGTEEETAEDRGPAGCKQYQHLNALRRTEGRTIMGRLYKLRPRSRSSIMRKRRERVSEREGGRDNKVNKK